MIGLPERNGFVRIALSGRSGSGKTTLARTLAPLVKAEVVSFSTPLKDCVRTLLDRAGIDPSSPILYRRCLQFVADDLLHLFGHDFFVRILEREIADRPAVIIDDLRTRVEKDWCRRQGFFLVRLVGSFSPLPAPLAQHWTEQDLEDVGHWDLVLDTDDLWERVELVLDRWSEWRLDRVGAGYRDDRSGPGNE